MSPWLATVCALALYALGYCVYAKYLARRVFRLDARRKTPAHAMMDGVDYVPTNRFVLFGHHSGRQWLHRSTLGNDVRHGDRTEAAQGIRGSPDVGKAGVRLTPTKSDDEFAG